eukprot:3571758-Rhodomonas_salina.6
MALVATCQQTSKKTVNTRLLPRTIPSARRFTTHARTCTTLGWAGSYNDRCWAGLAHKTRHAERQID